MTSVSYELYVVRVGKKNKSEFLVCSRQFVYWALDECHVGLKKTPICELKRKIRVRDGNRKCVYGLLRVLRDGQSYRLSTE